MSVVYPILLLAVGRLRSKPLIQLQDHYLDMLKPYLRLDLVELPEGKGEIRRQLQEEAQRIRERLGKVRRPVLLAAEGKHQSSEAFAAWMGAVMDRGESLAFAIGSSQGFDPSLRTDFPEALSLSPMTFPHDLSRILLLEQLYRALSILRGSPYHK